MAKQAGLQSLLSGGKAHITSAGKCDCHIAYLSPIWCSCSMTYSSLPPAMVRGASMLAGVALGLPSDQQDQVFKASFDIRCSGSQVKQIVCS